MEGQHDRDKEASTSTSARGSGTNGRNIGGGSGRRAAYVSVNHLLSFEVASGVGASITMTSPPKRHTQRGSKPGSHFTKERFIHANFRFLAREDIVVDKKIFFTDPDAPLDWNDIELVIVPAQHDVACPICLDTPITPCLTKCGHFFCWPCILQYASATSMAGSGNWRRCPICFESISVKQLKSVYFNQVEDYTFNTTTVSEFGIFMTVLCGDSNSCLVKPYNRAIEDNNNNHHQQHSSSSSSFSSSSSSEARKRIEKLSDLSPFNRITFVSKAFVLHEIIEREDKELRDLLEAAKEGEDDKVFIELALTMVDDRRMALDSETTAQTLQLSPSLATQDQKIGSRSETLSTTSLPLTFSNMQHGQKNILNSETPFSTPSFHPTVNTQQQRSPAKSFGTNNHPVSPLSLGGGSSSASTSTSSSQIYFHQALDGQPFFLCPLNIKMLRKHFGAYEALPMTLCAPVIEIEMTVMTEEIRKRYRYLHHLPLGCQFGLCELDLSTMLPSEVLEEFSLELKTRVHNRKLKARKEEKRAAEADRKAHQSQLKLMDQSRSNSPIGVPGIATGIFMEDYENFPLPPGGDDSINSGSIRTATLDSTTSTTAHSIPIEKSRSMTTKPLAGSFASIAATSPPNDGIGCSNGGFLVIPSNTTTTSNNLFEFSFDDVVSPNNNGDGGKKGKKVVLVSNTQRRHN